MGSQPSSPGQPGKGFYDRVPLDDNEQLQGHGPALDRNPVFDPTSDEPEFETSCSDTSTDESHADNAAIVLDADDLDADPSSGINSFGGELLCPSNDILLCLLYKDPSTETL